MTDDECSMTTQDAFVFFARLLASASQETRRFHRSSTHGLRGLRAKAGQFHFLPTRQPKLQYLLPGLPRLAAYVEAPEKGNGPP